MRKKSWRERKLNFQTHSCFISILNDQRKQFVFIIRKLVLAVSLKFIWIMASFSPYYVFGENWHDDFFFLNLPCIVPAFFSNLPSGSSQRGSISARSHTPYIEAEKTWLGVSRVADKDSVSAKIIVTTTGPLGNHKTKTQHMFNL